ncbi:MAG: hypothetical protein QNJ63_09910 [Calothrix sp. MO_192.B10]|nr:hypothetical protein [Calothrix sp. MO_192.B10]
MVNKSQGSQRIKDLLAALDWFIFVIAIVALLLFTAAYFSIPSILDKNNPITDFLQNIITNLIPVLLLFVVSYIAYRRIEAIRYKSDTEFLSDILSDELVRKLSHPDTRIEQLTRIEQRLYEIDIKAIFGALQNTHDAGIVAVHKSLYSDSFKEYISNAEEIIILNTFIPNLDFLTDALVTALNKESNVRILMLYPHSGISTLRSKSLKSSRDENQVRSGIEQCLDTLSSIARRLDDKSKQSLKVRLYNSLPSISVYSADERFFVSVFFHGQLAIKSPQIEVQSKKSILGKAISIEIETLWNIGQEFNDINNWRTEISIMAPKFNEINKNI